MYMRNNSGSLTDEEKITDGHVCPIRFALESFFSSLQVSPVKKF